MRPLDLVVRQWEKGGNRVALVWEELAGFRSFTAGQWARTVQRPRTWGTVYCALLVLIGYVILDRPLARFLKAQVTGEFEGFWKTITHLGLGGVWMVPAGLLALGLILSALAAPGLEERARLRRMAWVPGFLFLSMAASGIAGNIVKMLVGRTRPAALFDSGIYDFVPLTRGYLTNSFPSGHTQAIFAAMTALALIFPRYDLAFIAVALLVGLSRVLTTVHFLSDAVAGAWLGVMVTLVLHSLLIKRGIDVRVRFERDKRLLDQSSKGSPT
ncbi:membrane-associated phospholipid phosphatase [Paramagnetospirillum caucaseum]|uniref:Membrane-associated phospholipid phosphatase n=1 Tax=Paramagnetospirillum caucaseum TaxID=1244869 RepID=M2YFB9_9PROT|nr:phosphatase PAP2 family protein [Paramagnetospirillum caucaseum]EME71636.1 membrane-associated phospholipid phosphatase [Paramagnetospirillum caucaseum]